MPTASALGQPGLQELQLRLLSQLPPDRPESEVEPYHQALPHQWIDPQILWPDALAVAHLLLPRDQSSSFHAKSLKMPAGWAKRLGEWENLRLVPLGLGLVPALLRDVNPLLNGGVAALRDSGRGRAENAGSSGAVAGSSLTHQLLEAALVRLDRRFEESAEQLAAVVEHAPESWRSLLENETGVLAWMQGRHTEAERIWSESAASFSPVFRFNRALAALHRGDTAAAAEHLGAARKDLAADSGWRHLADLYLLVIEAE